MATIKERAKQAVQANYNCKGEYPCSTYKDCVFGCGTNTAYDCEECGADEFEVGYLKGATEQEEIVIKRACDWLKANTYSFRSDEFLEPLIEALKGE